MSIVSKLSKFARSPEGRRLAEQAKQMARDPEQRRKIEQFRAKLGSKRRPS